MLLENLPKEKIIFNKRLKQIKQDSSMISWEDGTHSNYEVLVACDGINSLVRKQLFPSIAKRYSDQTVWRGVTSKPIQLKFQDAYNEQLGNNVRFATIPFYDDRIYWYLATTSPEGLKDSTDVKKKLKQLLDDFEETAIEIIECSDKIYRNDMHDLNPVPKKWYSNNIILIGDSIHATTANLAQGACQAIEDAYTLSLCINKYGFDSAGSHLVNLRYKKVKSIVDESWSYGKFVHSTSNLKNFFRNLILKYLPSFLLRKKYQRLIDISYLNKL